MAKTPKDPKEIFEEFVSDYAGVYGKELVSVICFGSAARGEYRPGKSDINFMVVLGDDAIERLHEAFGVIDRWRARNVATPVFLTEAYVRSSVDVFPIEYLDIQKSHILVHGKDLLAELSFRDEHIRLQCEREVKGKLLLLRERFVETRGKAKDVGKLIAESLGAFIVVFEALLYLHRSPIPEKRADIVAAACSNFGLDGELFQILLRIRDRELKPSAEETLGYFRSYLKQIRNLSRIVDGMGGSNE